MGTPSEEFRAALRAKKLRSLRKIDLDDFPIPVYVWQPTVAEVDQYGRQQAKIERETPEGEKVHTVIPSMGQRLAFAIRDADANMIFDPENPSDVATLGEEMSLRDARKIIAALDPAKPQDDGAIVDPGKLGDRERLIFGVGEALGKTYEEVREIQERELHAWLNRGPLWPRRLELMLAQLAYLIVMMNSSSTGAKPMFRDFDLFDPKRLAERKVIANAAAAIAGPRAPKTHRIVRVFKPGVGEVKELREVKRRG